MNNEQKTKIQKRSKNEVETRTKHAKWFPPETMKYIGLKKEPRLSF